MLNNATHQKKTKDLRRFLYIYIFIGKQISSLIFLDGSSVMKDARVPVTQKNGDKILLLSEYNLYAYITVSILSFSHYL